MMDPGWVAVTLAAWLLTYALHSTVLLGSVGILAWLKKLPASLEQTLWKTALLGSLITATVVSLGLSGGTLGARIHLAPASSQTAVAMHQPALLPYSGSVDAELPAERTWIVLAAWAVTGLLGLGRLSRARRQLRDELGARRDLVSGSEWMVLEDLRRAASLDRRIRFTVSSKLGSPIAIGDDEICFPERALVELKPEEMRSALAHELAHLAHRDPAWKNVAAGVSALFFFQPLLKLARRRLDETAEYLADDWAVRHSGSEVSMARCLATVAGWQTRKLQTVAASGMAGGSSPLLKRVERLLGRRPSEPARIWCIAGAALLVLSGWVLAPGVTTRPRQVDTRINSAQVNALLPEVGFPSDVVPPPPAEVFVTHAPLVPMVTVHRHAPRMAPRLNMHAPHAPDAPDMADRTPLPDRDTAPVAQVIIIPHQALQARLEILRSMAEVQNLSPEAMHALIAAEQRLFEMEMAARGIRVVWMTPEPSSPPTPPAPPTHI